MTLNLFKKYKYSHFCILLQGKRGKTGFEGSPGERGQKGNPGLTGVNGKPGVKVNLDIITNLILIE